LKKIAKHLEKVAKTFASPKKPKYPHQSQFESPKHQHQTTYEALKYLQQTKI
jgi:hypothetical protein